MQTIPVMPGEQKILMAIIERSGTYLFDLYSLLEKTHHQHPIGARFSDVRHHRNGSAGSDGEGCGAKASAEAPRGRSKWVVQTHRSSTRQSGASGSSGSASRATATRSKASRATATWFSSAW